MASGIRAAMSEQAGAAPSGRVYDVVVIGGGPVGVALAQRTRADGLGVVIVEKELLGAECDYWACVPSKPLLRPVVAIEDARRVRTRRVRRAAPRRTRRVRTR